jgi:hypothetical protein
MRLLKADIIAMLHERGVDFKKSLLRVDLLKILLQSVFADATEEYIAELMAGFGAAAKTAEEQASDRLAKDPDLSEALDALAGMDADSAQAFPELAKAQKARRRRESKKWEKAVATEKEASRGEEVANLSFQDSCF